MFFLFGLASHLDNGNASKFSVLFGLTLLGNNVNASGVLFTIKFIANS